MDSDGMGMDGMTTSMGGMGGMNSMQCMKHQMWTYFHVKPDDTILFDFWGVSNAGEMVWSSFIIFGLAFLPEFIKFLRWKIEQHQKMDELPYILMLCFMTFNVWLCIAVISGMTTGYLAFGSRQERSSFPSHL